MPKSATPPHADALSATLGPAEKIWDAVIKGVREDHAPLELEWRPSTSDFGLMCLLRQKKRTLLYMTPGAKSIVVGVVLGERAVEAALASQLPQDIKDLIHEARPYIEGRGIRFPVAKQKDVSTVLELVRIKTS
jgi:hypothetical protein